MKPWRRIEPTTVQKAGHRTVTTKTFQYPDGTTNTYDVVQRDGWAGVATIALTPDKKVIVVQQFRPGPEQIMFELPGGAVEKGEADELERAARRELGEETAYAPGAIVYLGKLSYDAHVNGWRHYFLATDCVPTGEARQLDESERREGLVVRRITINRLLENARHGRMTDPGAVLLAYEILQKLKEDT